MPGAHSRALHSYCPRSITLWTLTKNNRWSDDIKMKVEFEICNGPAPSMSSPQRYKGKKPKVKVDTIQLPRSSSSIHCLGTTSQVIKGIPFWHPCLRTVPSWFSLQMKCQRRRSTPPFHCSQSTCTATSQSKPLSRISQTRHPVCQAQPVASTRTSWAKPWEHQTKCKSRWSTLTIMLCRRSSSMAKPWRADLRRSSTLAAASWRTWKLLDIQQPQQQKVRSILGWRKWRSGLTSWGWICMLAQLWLQMLRKQLVNLPPRRSLASKLKEWFTKMVWKQPSKDFWVCCESLEPSDWLHLCDRNLSFSFCYLLGICSSEKYSICVFCLLLFWWQSIAEAAHNMVFRKLAPDIPKKDHAACVLCWAGLC